MNLNPLDKRVEILKTKYRWYEGIARALVDAKGRCVYCGEDLMDTRLGYSSIVMDHLLPKAIYSEFEHNYTNHVLSCSSCNSIKGNFDPVRNGENPQSMLENRELLIERCIAHLKAKIDARKLEWEDIRSILNEN